MPPERRTVPTTWARLNSEVVNVRSREPIGGKGDAVENFRRIVAEAIAPCEPVADSGGGVFVRARNGRNTTRVPLGNKDVRWKWHCRFGGCAMGGSAGYDLGSDVDGTVDITVQFNQDGGAPCHYEAQEEYGVAELRGETRRKVVGALSAALPGAQKVTPTALYNANLAAARSVTERPTSSQQPTNRSEIGRRREATSTHRRRRDGIARYRNPNASGDERRRREAMTTTKDDEGWQATN